MKLTKILLSARTQSYCLNLYWKTKVKKINVADKILSNPEIDNVYGKYLAGFAVNKEEGSKKWDETDVFEDNEDIDKNIGMIKNNLSILKINSEIEFYSSKLKSANEEEQNQIKITLNDLLKKKKALQ